MATLANWDLGLQRGAHVCHFFSTDAEKKAVVLPFLLHGLQANEHCLFTTCDHSPDDWFFELQAYGVDVQAMRDRGALVILEEQKTRVPGPFNAIRLAKNVWGMVDGLLRAFSGVRLVREVPWAEGGALSVADLCHMEATWSLLIENSNVRSLCQYDLRHHPAPVIHTALRTHSLVIVDGTLYKNPFYDAPNILANEPDLFESNARDDEVREMLGRFRR